MRTAVVALRNKKTGSTKAASMFEVPQSTMERYLKNVEKSPWHNPRLAGSHLFHPRQKQISLNTA
jgi:hypothetical protein